jgi:hypothetical protein
MATFQEFARQLLILGGKLRRFYREKIAGKRAITFEWHRHYQASLANIENILNDLKNLAPNFSNAQEIMERVKLRLEK